MHSSTTQFIRLLKRYKFVAPPPPPVPMEPVFQSFNSWDDYNPRIANTISSMYPFEQDRRLKTQHDVIQGAGAGFLRNPQNFNRSSETLYDELSDFVYSANSSTNVVACSDSRSMSLVWKFSMQDLGYYGVYITATTPGLVWYRARNSGSTEYYLLGASTATGSIQNIIVLPNSFNVPGKGTFNLSDGDTSFAQMLDNDVICLGKWYDSVANDYFMIYVKITGTGTFTWHHIVFPVANYQADSLWGGRNGKAYVLCSANPSDVTTPLVHVVNLTSHVIETTVMPPPHLVGIRIYAASFKLNETKTRAYISEHGVDYTMLEFDITQPGWTYLGSYGSNVGISNGIGQQGDEYVYHDGYIYGISGQYSDAFPVWQVGTYQKDALFYGATSSQFANYSILLYGDHAYSPFRDFESTYNAGHCSNWWLLPASQRNYTPPVFTGPPTVDIVMQPGYNGEYFTMTQQVMWFRYDWDGQVSIEFNAGGQAGGHYCHTYIFDSDGYLLKNGDGYNKWLSRTNCLPGSYYIVLIYVTSYQAQVAIGSRGWSVDTSALTPAGAALPRANMYINVVPTESVP